MVFNENTEIKNRIEKIRNLIGEQESTEKLLEAVSLARSLVYDIRGDNHPVMRDLDKALSQVSMRRGYAAVAACRSVITLYEEGGLSSPRLAIAHEIEGDILAIAQKQVEVSETTRDANHKQLQLGIAAFLAGVALEDALRRLCDANSINYNPQRTSISKLREALYQPLEVISRSDNKQITAWGDTRNKADHGRFSEIIHSEVLSMVIGVRGFIDKHLP